MRHGPKHLAHRNTSLIRFRRRRMQIKALRRRQHKTKEIFFMLENSI